jgi:hypothetical protein
MMQIARHMTTADRGFLEPGQYVIDDQGGNVPFCAAPSQRG